MFELDKLVTANGLILSSLLISQLSYMASANSHPLGSVMGGRGQELTSDRFPVSPICQFSGGSPIAPLVPPNSERFFREGREQFEEEIRLLPERRQLREGNSLQIEGQLREEFEELLRERGVRSLEELTILDRL